jgi:hypothetical protein
VSALLFFFPLNENGMSASSCVYRFRSECNARVERLMCPQLFCHPPSCAFCFVTSPAREAMSESDKKIDFDLNLKVNTPFF